jgi:hypothetical protein
MSEVRLPDLKEKTKRLHARDATPTGLSAQGEQYFQAGWLSDAIDFFERAKDTDGLTKIMNRAIDEGDVFLLRRCLKALGKEDKDGDWLRLARRALALGKLMFAREGFRMAEDRKGLDQVDAMLKPPAPDAAAPSESTSATTPPSGGDSSHSG